MTEGLSGFRFDMDRIASLASSGKVSSKALRYLRAYDAGLPQDITVRWFPANALADMEERIVELTKKGLEVWISQGLPWNASVDSQLTSVERKTDLIKGIKSLEDFQHRAIPILKLWEPGSWAKMFYDTPQRSLTGGTIRIDTNRFNDLLGIDKRSMRFEVATGISDVRDLDRQMSAKQIVIIHPDTLITKKIALILKKFDISVIGVESIDEAWNKILEITTSCKPIDNPKAKASEPKAIIVEFDSNSSKSQDLIKKIKNNSNTSYIPIIPMVHDTNNLPIELRTMVASIIQSPINENKIERCVYNTGFRLVGSSSGFQIPNLNSDIQADIVSLLKIVFGPGSAYRRMMVQIANAEQRPTIAFEFKLVPIAPYDFFFLDYEWSGTKNEYHRFDWLFNFSDGA